jgi:zinc D-Ala-D-Ala carboxypeptidase
MIRRWAALLLVIVVAVAVGQCVLHNARTPPRTVPPPSIAAPPERTAASAAASAPVTLMPGPRPTKGCHPAAGYTAGAAMNAQSLRTAVWSAFRRSETGWEIYAPLIAHEIGVDCPPNAEGFAAALADWQEDHRLGQTGVMDAATLSALNKTWEGRRPFVAASAHGVCPAPPPASALAQARPEEGYGGKPVQLRVGALDAYRRMVAAARAQEPVLAADRRMLTIFSGYRDPIADTARCASEQNCDTIVRANCSAHLTGLAMDLYLGEAPGFPPDSAADPSRLYLSHSNAYLWMVAHAGAFGFVNYPFEPWHWEWTGEPP